MKAEHDGNNIMFSQCAKTFKSNSGLLVHERKHRYPFDKCDQGYNDIMS